jgi:hypothetical protein
VHRRISCSSTLGAANRIKPGEHTALPNVAQTD